MKLVSSLAHAENELSEPDTPLALEGSRDIAGCGPLPTSVGDAGSPSDTGGPQSSESGRIEPNSTKSNSRISQPVPSLDAVSRGPSEYGKRASLRRRVGEIYGQPGEKMWIWSMPYYQERTSPAVNLAWLLRVVPKQRISSATVGFGCICPHTIRQDGTRHDW